MNGPSFGDRFLNFATRLAIRILPKEAKVVVRKYKKYRNARGGYKAIEAKLQPKMPPKGSKKKVQEAAAVPAVGPEQVKEASVEKIRKMSLEGVQADVSKSIKTASPNSSTQVDSSNDTTTTVENVNNKTRFQKYNIRLEDIIKFRERLSEIEIKQLSLGPSWSKTIDEVDVKAQNEVQKARDEAADAQIEADNLKDQLEESSRLLEAAKIKNERFTREIDAQRQDTAQLQQQLSQAQSKLAEVSEKCEELQAQVEQKDKNVQDVKGKYVSERDARTRAEHALKQQEAEAARQLHIKEGEINHIIIEHRNQLEMKNDEIANMIQEIRKIEENYREALAKKVADLDAIYARRYSEHEGQLNAIAGQIKDKDKEVEALKLQLEQALSRIAVLENEKATLKAALEGAQKTEGGLKDLVADIKKDLEKVRQAYKDADKELKDKEVKFVVEDFEPEFIKYDGLLMIEEKRIGGIQQRQNTADFNNN